MKPRTRQTIAQFSNGVAIAVLAAGIIGPAANRHLDLGNLVISVSVAAALHLLALAVVNGHGG